MTTHAGVLMENYESLKTIIERLTIRDFNKERFRYLLTLLLEAKHALQPSKSTPPADVEPFRGNHTLVSGDNFTSSSWRKCSFVNKELECCMSTTYDRSCYSEMGCAFYPSSSIYRMRIPLCMLHLHDHYRLCTPKRNIPCY